MTSLVLTITETLRYRGKIGQWAWALHRVSGFGTFVFLVMHVIDTSWATFYPELYAKAVAAYKTPLFTVGEFALVACVVYHALNGFRIALFDYRPQWWRRQADAAKLVLLGTLVLLVPAFFVMAGHVVNYYNERVSVFDLGLDKVVEATAPFAVGTVVVLGLGLAVSAGASLIPSLNAPKKRLKGSKMETFMWSFMRISGVLIIPLVFGHLAMMHVIQGVFDLTRVGHVPVFTNLGPNMDAYADSCQFCALALGYDAGGRLHLARLRYPALAFSSAAWLQRRALHHQRLHSQSRGQSRAALGVVRHDDRRIVGGRFGNFAERASDHCRDAQPDFTSDQRGCQFG
jgi:succinate dehydrogenase / fumarate reductase cytochrome b subunit